MSFAFTSLYNPCQTPQRLVIIAGRYPSWPFRNCVRCVSILLRSCTNPSQGYREDPTGSISGERTGVGQWYLWSRGVTEAMSEWWYCKLYWGLVSRANSVGWKRNKAAAGDIHDRSVKTHPYILCAQSSRVQLHRCSSSAKPSAPADGGVVCCVFIGRAFSFLVYCSSDRSIFLANCATVLLRRECRSSSFFLYHTPR